MIGLIENTGGGKNKLPHMPKGYLFALVDNIFKEGGYLQTEMQLDHRAEQADMAASVATSLESDQPLLFEAGTGVGKSLAYLIPGIIHSFNSERPFIVSTHTISLQEQIREKDLKQSKITQITPNICT